MAARDSTNGSENNSRISFDLGFEMTSPNISTEAVITLLNFNPRALAEHEAMLAEALEDEALASNLRNDENFVANGVQAAQSRISILSPARPSNSSPLRQRTPQNTGRNAAVGVSPMTPPATPKTNVTKENKNISTLVFFDLETTGLPHEMGKHNVQITELSMIAMKRMEYEKSVHTDLKDVRIVQKLSMCFQPRAAIAPMAAKITGLNSSNLHECSTFDHNAATTVLSFLAHLPKPVCLLAHNGKSFDFPIFKAELNRHQMQLSSDILIADTLLAIKDLGIPVFPPTKKVCKSVKFRNGQISYGLENLHLFFFNKKPVGSHSSEGDCIALAKVCHFMKDTMLPWLDCNSALMESVKPLW